MTILLKKRVLKRQDAIVNESNENSVDDSKSEDVKIGDGDKSKDSD